VYITKRILHQLCVYGCFRQPNRSAFIIITMMHQPRPQNRCRRTHFVQSCKPRETHNIIMLCARIWYYNEYWCRCDEPPTVKRINISPGLPTSRPGKNKHPSTVEEALGQNRTHVIYKFFKTIGIAEDINIWNNTRWLCKHVNNLKNRNVWLIMKLRNI